MQYNNNFIRRYSIRLTRFVSYAALQRLFFWEKMDTKEHWRVQLMLFAWFIRLAARRELYIPLWNIHIYISRSFLSYFTIFIFLMVYKKAPWSESAGELYRPSDRRLSAKWLPTFVDRECHVVSVTDPYDRILDFLDRSRCFSIK
jgi:hypothetical protein